MADNLDSRAKRGSLSKEKYKKAVSLIKGTLDYNDFNDVDLVIEVVDIFFPVNMLYS